jgi:hypothetical protein
MFLCSARLLSRLAARGAADMDGAPSPALEDDGTEDDGKGHDDDDDGPMHDDDEGVSGGGEPRHDEAGEGHDDDGEGHGNDDIDGAHAKASGGEEEGQGVMRE